MNLKGYGAMQESKTFKDDVQGKLIFSLSSLIKEKYGNYENLILEFFPPTDEGKGDLTTNFALRNSKILKEKPIKIAENVKKILEESEYAPNISKIDIAGPGFINIWYSDSFVKEIVYSIIEANRNYGCPYILDGRKVLIEFVSANPTGPLTIAHARQAAVGDTLVRMMRKCGANVSSEYYLNDRGVQISILGKSLYYRYLELCGKNVDFPEEGYKGNYIIDIAKEFYNQNGDKYAESSKDEVIGVFSEYAYKVILEWIKKDLKDFRIKFDTFFSEKEMEDKGEIEKALRFLKEEGYAYEKDGALWFKTTDFGDEKDRVLVKQDGTTTYLASDIPYHWDKIKRGYDMLIDIVGPDHHGYISRLKAAVGVLDRKNMEKLHVLIVQLTTLYRGNTQLRMSTRAGEFVSLRQLLDEVGTDAGRYFFISRKPNSHLDFDLELAKKKTPENPVFYIQYAHARTESLFRKYLEDCNENSLPSINEADFNLLNEDEKKLIRKMANFPTVIRNSAFSFEPQRLAVYLEELTALFHAYYNKYRIVDKDNLQLTKIRLIICICINIIIKEGLRLVGVSAPEKM